MGAAPSLSSRPCADRAAGDVLVSGSERAPWSPSARLLGACAAAVLVAATLGVTLALVRASQAEDARALALRAAQDRLPMALRTGPALIPRHRGGVPPGQPASARVHVEVVNEGSDTVRVVSGALTPGSWLVDVVDRDVVTPGESLVLALHRSVDCSGEVPPGPAPEQLVLTALLPDQSPASVAVDVAREQPAYAGRLDDVLRDPARACSAPSGPWNPMGP